MTWGYVRRPTGRKNKSEEKLSQKRFVDYLYVTYKLLLTAPSGGSVQMSSWKGAELRDLGYRAGTPDLLIFKARGVYHGLHIEMKIKGGRVSPQQKEWIKEATEEGYKAVAVWSLEEAKKVIDDYMTKGV